jgi:hypothetical protein
MRPKVDRLVPFLPDHADHDVFEGKAGVIASDSDLHPGLLLLKRSCGSGEEISPSTRLFARTGVED